jgi:hypothetical protein
VIPLEGEGTGEAGLLKVLLVVYLFLCLFSLEYVCAISMSVTCNFVLFVYMCFLWRICWSFIRHCVPLREVVSCVISRDQHTMLITEESI